MPTYLYACCASPFSLRSSCVPVHYTLCVGKDSFGGMYCIRLLILAHAETPRLTGLCRHSRVKHTIQYTLNRGCHDIHWKTGVAMIYTGKQELPWYTLGNRSCHDIYRKTGVAMIYPRKQDLSWCQLCCQEWWENLRLWKLPTATLATKLVSCIIFIVHVVLRY